MELSITVSGLREMFNEYKELTYFNEKQVADIEDHFTNLHLEFSQMCNCNTLEQVNKYRKLINDRKLAIWNLLQE